MAISPWTKPLDMKIAPLPFEALAYGYEKREKRQDEADKLYTDLESEFSKIKAIKDIDTPKRDERLNQYRNMVSGLYDQSKGDPNTMLSGLRQIRSKFMQDVNYGDLGQMHQKAVALEQAQEDYKKASTEGKFSGLDDYVYKAAILKPLEQYASVGGHSRDDKGLTTNLNLGSMPKLPEVGEKLSQFAQQWAATTYGGPLKASGTPGYFVTVKGKMVSEDEVMKGVSDYLFSAPEFRTVNKLIADATPDNFATEIKNSEGKVVQKLTGPSAGVYDFYRGTINAIAERESFYETTPDYMKDEAYWRALDKKEEETVTPLALTFDQQVNPVQNVLKNIDNLTNPRTLKSVSKYPLTFFGGTDPNAPPVVFNSQQTFDQLPPYDKQVVEFIRSTTPALKDKAVSSLTAGDWDVLKSEIAKKQNVKVSPVIRAYDKSTKVTERGKHYDNYMESYLFFDPSSKEVTSGTDLRAEGWKVVSGLGTISSDNTIPMAITGAQKYTFAAPEKIVLENQEGKRKEVYVNKNDAEIKSDPNYIPSVIENAVLSANSLQFPVSLFESNDFTVLPATLDPNSKANPKLSFKIVNANGDAMQYENATATDLRTTVLKLYFGSPVMQELVNNNLFKNQ